MSHRIVSLIGISLVACLLIFFFSIQTKNYKEKLINEAEIDWTYKSPPRYDFGLMSALDNMALAGYALGRLTYSPIETDMQEWSRRVRLFRDIHPNSQHTIHSEFGRKLESQIYGYVLDKYGSTTSLARSFYGNGKGIVITTGNNYFQFAIHILRSLKVLGCTLDVEIWYNGKNDLNSTSIKFVRTFYGVTVKNIQSHFSTSMETWDIKPFAVLASSFEEVILMDADTVFLRNPSILFEDEGYLKTGALFFNDRSLFPFQKEKVDWVRNLFPSPLSNRLKKLRMFSGKTQYEIESGVVVIDKRRHFHGLLAVCKLNCPGILKDMIREQTHGEKETFWMGLEMANEPYSIMPQLPGALGTVSYNAEEHLEELCGKLAHFDRSGSLLWFNDAIAASKLPDDFIREPAELTHYAKEAEGIWENLCLRKCPFHKVDPGFTSIIDTLKKIYQYDPQERIYKPETFDDTA